MAFKKIVWSDLAKDELHHVLEFYTLRNGSPGYSLKLLDEIDHLLVALAENKFLGRLASNRSTRVLPLRYYLIFYEVTINQIEIVSFWDNRQNPKKRKVK
ncbi:type II toxin-antitoxin system RelE/ParE family toxin [Algoriphagus aestuariicola]|jgi:plasmid stabilization system protein ParE|uniref:Type II toxin-antitoxin system RelE/ParE family toxin n=1 Tax=Algoriphagus aestuariicola TaxID=1852016 RepID=A0ABS3BZY9_9BACT|nr:type II toxin-antitoxin system RelE/ParE family toxin [Algoriphagus aestuariicola]MBN7803294.1 type II toxin-antitoxin system RelE/ParE family toxin [Algoriphagus aestuariicola]